MATTENNRPGSFARLTQHHIYRVVTVYAIAAWILLQSTNSIFPDIGLSRADVRIVLVALLLGFPVVLVVAWTLIKPNDPAKLSRWQRLHWKLGAALSIGVVTLVVISGNLIWKVSKRHAQELAAAQSASRPAPASAFRPPADSIVVLPFINLTGDPRQQYFSDGVTEELTDALGEIPALRVIAWNTASTFRNTAQTATAVGTTLNVADLLQGSILREGDEVRVTAELVNTVTGYELWSAQYDEPLKNLFAVQDHISQAIAAALQVKFAGAGTASTLNPEAHDWVLKGLAGLDRDTVTSLEAAQRDIRRAIVLDPHYAEAYAALARSYVDLSEVSTLPLAEWLPDTQAMADRALKLDPDNVDALVDLGNADASDNRLAQAHREFERALALDPSNAAAHTDFGNMLPLIPSLAQDQEAVLLDPSAVVAQNNLAADYLDLRDFRQARAPIVAIMRLSPEEIDSAFYLAFIDQQLHRDTDMVTAFDRVKPVTALDRQLVKAGRLTYASLLKPARRGQALRAVAQLRGARLSPDAQSDLLQLYVALGDNQDALTLLPGYCANDPTACNDLAINPVFDPLHGEPRFAMLAKRYTTITLH